jgi:hypothetical protein
LFVPSAARAAQERQNPRGGEAAPRKAAPRNTANRRGHRPDRRIGEWPDERAEAIVGNPHVAVADDEDAVLGERHHVDEVRHLAVGAVLCRIDDERDVARRELRHDPSNDWQGWIRGIGDAEDDLQPGMFLPAKRPEAVEQIGIGPAERLQDRHRRPVERIRRAAWPKPPDAPDRQGKVGDPGAGERQQERFGDQHYARRHHLRIVNSVPC